MEPKIGAFGSANMSDLAKMGMALDFSNSRMHLKAGALTDSGDKIIINFLSVIDRHSENLNKFLIDYEMSEEEFQLYQYKPRLFCLDKFETMELWALLLRVNNMISVTQFNRPKIKSFDSAVIRFIEEILIAEEDELLKNRIDVYED